MRPSRGSARSWRLNPVPSFCGKAVRDGFVNLRGLDNPPEGRLCASHRGRVAAQCFLGHLAGVDGRTVDGQVLSGSRIMSRQPCLAALLDVTHGERTHGPLQFSGDQRDGLNFGWETGQTVSDQGEFALLGDGRAAGAAARGAQGSAGGGELR